MSALGVLTTGIVASAAYASTVSYVTVPGWGRQVTVWSVGNTKQNENYRSNVVTGTYGLPGLPMYEKLVNSNGEVRSLDAVISYNTNASNLYGSAHAGYTYYSRVQTNNLEPNSQTISYRFSAQ